jgi:hypothetical protein
LSTNRSVLAAGALVLVLAACKSTNRYRTARARDASAEPAGSRDGSSSDAGGDGGGALGAFDGFIPEGATMDAAVLGLDASLDLPRGTLILEDGAIVLPDGQVIDVDAAIERYPRESDVSSCAIGEEDTWSTQVRIFDEGGFSLVPGPIGFGLAFRGTRVAGCAQTLEVMTLGAAMGFGEPRPIDTACSVITDVSLLGTADGWRVAWVDNFTNSEELHTLALDADMNVEQGAVRETLTSNAGKRERKPVLREVAGRPLAAWISEDVASKARSIQTQLLDGMSAARIVLDEGAGETPEAIALAQMSTDGAALAWVGPLASPGVWLQPLDATGAAGGERVKLSDKVAASSSVDMATRLDGGAVVYSVEVDGSPQVRFRRLDPAGKPLASERSIIGPPLRAQGASIAPLGGGYAVTYRALPGGGIDATQVRLTFVTKEGNLLRDAGGRLRSFHIGDATMAQGRTAVSVSVDGELMVAWLDADLASGENVLKVVRRRLDCK